MTIKQIKPNVTNLKLNVIIRKVMQGVTATGNPYLTLLLQDNSGQISARIWEVKPQDLTELAAGKIIELTATSLTYNNEIQLKVVSYQVIDTTDEELLAELISTAPINAQQEWKFLTATVADFTDQTLKQIITYLLKQYEASFYTRPAAVKMHHNTRNGLLWHTITMLKTAQALVKIYHDRQINVDLLYAGIIMHDFGKLWELSDELITSFTLQGQMLGHIVLGSEQISVACAALKIDSQTPIVILLQHLVLASHGKYEYGSPVLPKTLEAEILHHVDNLDAKITIIDEMLKTTEIGQNTSRIPSIDNRVFFNHFTKKP